MLNQWFQQYVGLIHAQRINELKEEDNNENIKLRVAVDSGGCSGYKYSVEVEENVEPEDWYAI